MLASAAIGPSASFLPGGRQMVGLQENSDDKDAVARMLFSVWLVSVGCGPNCIAGISFCQYPRCDCNRNRHAAHLIKVRAGE